MSRGMDIAAQGMNVLALKQEVIANNLANVNTAGFKRDILPSRSFSAIFDEQLGMVGGGVAADKPVMRSGQGVIASTGNPLNVALSGEGFFVVQHDDGQAYTRSGSFNINSEGELVNSEGKRVLGEGGPITLPDGQVSFNDNGDVLVDGRTIDSLRIVSVDDKNAVEKLGKNLFTVANEDALGPRPEATQTVWKSLESSDVSAVEEMVQMIQILRSFEASQKVILSIDENLKKAVTLGRP